MTSNALKIILYLYCNLFTGDSKFIAGFSVEASGHECVPQKSLFSAKKKGLFLEDWDYLQQRSFIKAFLQFPTCHYIGKCIKCTAF